MTKLKISCDTEAFARRALEIGSNDALITHALLSYKLRFVTYGCFVLVVGAAVGRAAHHRLPLATAIRFFSHLVRLLSTRKIVTAIGLIMQTVWIPYAVAGANEASQWRVGMELGAFTAAHNRIQIPNDNQGDRFNINDFGAGSDISAKVIIGWRPRGNHEKSDGSYEIAFVYAPFQYSRQSRLEQDLRYRDATFAADELTEASYQFSNYRLRYLRDWYTSGRWDIDLGGTLFVRDAATRLTHVGTDKTRVYENIGIVPLFALRVGYRLNKDWGVLLDTDFFVGSSRGRAIDLSLLGLYQVSQHWRVATGYRSIEGGADNDRVYNFAWFNGLVAQATYTW